jgi:hypothetical protein
MPLLPPRSPRNFSQLDGSSFRLSLCSVGHRQGRQRAPSANGVPRLRATLAILEPFDRISIRSEGRAAIFESARGGVEREDAKGCTWTPTHCTEDPNLFSELDCNLLALRKTFGLWLQCVYLWVSRSAPNLPISRDAPACVSS